VAVVILRDQTTPDPMAWTTECKRLMASYKVPVHFEVVSAFPSVESANAVKIQKNKLREMADTLLADKQ
jgi:fatty-acyl-CoA synthase